MTRVERPDEARGCTDGPDNMETPATITARVAGAGMAAMRRCAMEEDTALSALGEEAAAPMPVPDVEGYVDERAKVSDVKASPVPDETNAARIAALKAERGEMGPYPKMTQEQIRRVNVIEKELGELEAWRHPDSAVVPMADRGAA